MQTISWSYRAETLPPAQTHFLSSGCLHMYLITAYRLLMTEHQRSADAVIISHDSCTVSSFFVPHFIPCLIPNSSSFHPPSLCPRLYHFPSFFVDMAQRRQAAKAVATATHHGPWFLSGGGEWMLGEKDALISKQRIKALLLQSEMKRKD